MDFRVLKSSSDRGEEMQHFSPVFFIICNKPTHKHIMKDKNIIRLYLLVALSLIFNVIFIFAGHAIMNNNIELQSRISEVSGKVHSAECDVQYLKEMLDLTSKRLDVAIQTERKHNKEDKTSLCALSDRILKLENEAERFSNVTSSDEIQKINEDIRQLKQDVKSLKWDAGEIKFKQANMVTSLRQEIKNLEENLKITNTFQWSAIRKLKQACPWVGLFD